MKCCFWKRIMWDFKYKILEILKGKFGKVPSNEIIFLKLHHIFNFFEKLHLFISKVPKLTLLKVENFNTYKKINRNKKWLIYFILSYTRKSGIWYDLFKTSGFCNFRISVVLFLLYLKRKTQSCQHITLEFDVIFCYKL